MKTTYFPNTTERALITAEALDRSARYNLPLDAALDQAWDNFQLLKEDAEDDRYEREERGE